MPSQITTVRYPPTRLCWARVINLSANVLNPFLDVPAISPFLVKLHSISTARNANVLPDIAGVLAGRPYSERLKSEALPVIDDFLPINAYFDESFALSFYATADVSNYQARADFEVMPYSVADKLALGVSEEALTDEEKELSDKYQLRRRILANELPMPYPKGALLYQLHGTFSGDLAAGAEETILETTVQAGNKAVLTELWAKRPTADYGNLEIRVYLERQLYLMLHPYCFPEFATTTRYIRPIQLWIPAIRHLSVTIYSGTGHTGLLALAKFDMRRMTIWDKIQWGLLPNKVYTSAWERILVEEYNLEEKLKAGIYKLLVPLKVS